MFDYTTDNLVQSVRDVVYAAASVRDWDNAKVLRLLNRMMVGYLVPFIEEHRKDYFVTFVDIPIIANQTAYRIPSKATGQRVRDVLLVDSNGNPYSRVTEMALETAAVAGSSTIVGQYPAGIPRGYYFGGGGNSLVLWPAPTGSPTLSLRVFYAARPSSLVYQKDCLHVTSLAPGVPPVGPAAAPVGFFRVGIDTNLDGAAPVYTDLVQNRPGFDVLLSNAQTHGALANFYIELPGTLPADLQVGDWVCAADTAPVMTGGIADVLIDCLVEACALRIVSAPPDEGAIKAHTQLLHLAEKAARTMLNMRRNIGDRKKVGSGALYRNKAGGGWQSG